MRTMCIYGSTVQHAGSLCDRTMEKTQNDTGLRHFSHIFGVLTVSNLSVFYRLHNCSQVAYTTDLPHLELPQEYLVVMDYKRELHSSTL